MNETKYAFFIETEDGQEVRWSNLTKRQAESLYKWTDEHLPMNIKTHGWEEVK